MNNCVRLAVSVLGSLWLSVASAESPSFSYDGQEYQGDKLPPAVQQSLYDVEMKANDQRRQVIDQYIVNRYLQEKSAAEGKTVKQLQQQLLQVPKASEADIKAFYDSNRGRINAPYEQVKGRVAEFIQSQQQAAKEGQLLAQIMTEKGYRLKIYEAQAPRFEVATEGYPFKGNPDAKVTMIEFADYQCPHCKEASHTVKNLLKQFDGQLKVVFRDYPINPSGISRRVAEAAVCAAEQDKFWPFHDLAFERQSYLKAIKPEMLAEQLALNMEKFNSCFAGNAAKDKVTASLEEGVRLGLSGTPTFFVNGLKLHVHGELEPALINAIEQALKNQAG
ncbi:MAG: thioredoxin domain-containing protein [Motiliproteus sp.]